MNKLWLALLMAVLLGYFALSRPRSAGAGDPVWVEELQIGRKLYR
jgi:hypothetical protein